MRTKFLLFLIFLCSNIFGQEWSPVGTKWYYDITYAWGRDIDYHEVYCDSSVNIKGIDCKRINIDYYACNNHFSEKLYTYESFDTIYFYNQDIDNFEILYNFNAIAGDSWQIRTKDHEDKIDTVEIKVDSTGMININDKQLKKLYVTYKYNYKHSSSDWIETYQDRSTIIESLGDINFLININDKYRGVCDIDFIHSLRCYEDTVLGYYSTGYRDSCTYTYKWTSINNKSVSNILKVYPNPFNNVLTISNDFDENIYYEIYSFNGLLIKSGTENEIDLSYVKYGVYILRAKINNENIKSIKIIKHLP
jgi:hypothetical protein